MNISRRIIGIETEYGITCASLNGSQPPLNADQAAKILFKPVIVKARTSNVFTRGGARLYLDVGSHPEFATAECDQLEDLLAQDRAGEIIMARLAEKANSALQEQEIPGTIHIIKNNVDAHGAGFGCHENYLVRRHGNFWNDVRTLIPHLVTRQILVGAGHVWLDTDSGAPRFVFSQRANQMEDAVSAATTRARPLINARDEPHADAERYRRLHVIAGDSNIAQGSTLLKVGAMNFLLDYLESGGVLADLQLVNPMRDIRRVCQDLSARTILELADGRTITALDMQIEHFERVSKHIKNIDLTVLQKATLNLWSRGLEALAAQRPQDVAAELDWAAKYQLLNRYAQRLGVSLADARVARMELAYHDVSATEGLRLRLETRGLLRRYLDESTCIAAQTSPPRTTRAYLRARVIAKAADLHQDLAVDWVNLKLANASAHVVSLRDPFANSDARVDALLAMMEAENSWTLPPSI